MNKIVDGVELLRMIRDGEISKEKKIYIESKEMPFRFYITSGIYNAIHLYRVEGNKEVDVRALDTEDLLKDKYIIPEEDEEIDIEAIKKYETKYTERCIDKEVRNKINELIKAIKQLNKKVEFNEKNKIKLGDGLREFDKGFPPTVLLTDNHIPRID